MTGYPLLDLFWTMLEVFLWVVWFFLLFRVVGDIFRSHDLGGWGRAGWIILVIVLPFIGVLAYVIVRGHGMGERDMELARRRDAAFKDYIRQAAASEPSDGGPVDALARLAQLRRDGEITEDEFRRAKERLLA